MSKYIPVEPEKWAEMVKAQAEVAELKAEVIRLQQVRGYEHYLSAEIGFMHQENVRLKAECQARQAENSVLAVECDSLKAEVERLKELNATLSLRYDATKSMLDGCAKEIEEMEAEVERLTKAGDNMERAIQANGCDDNGDWDDNEDAMKQWNAAKKGGQP
jgi:chromosome segregation ATPase